MIAITEKDIKSRNFSCQNDLVVLCGPPQRMTGNITLSHKLENRVFVDNIKIQSTINTINDQVVIKRSVEANSKRNLKLRYSLPNLTPSGNYDAFVIIGEKKISVKLIVEEYLNLEIKPSSFLLSGIKPKEQFEREMFFLNNSNIDVKIPEFKHITLVDNSYLCKSLALSFTKSLNGFKEILNDVTRNIQSNYVMTADFNIKESGKIFVPGESTMLHLTFTLPKNINVNSTYFGNINFLGPYSITCRYIP